MSDLSAFFETCISQLRPTGWFAGPRFDDIEEVLECYSAEFMSAEEVAEFENDADLFESHKPFFLSGLLALDHAHCVHFDIKKRGAESGAGYYETLVRRIVGCFADGVITKEVSRPTEQGFPGIVTVVISGVLKPSWAEGSGLDGAVSDRQAFAPVRSWSDLIFVEQIVCRLLGTNVARVLSRVGQDEEAALYIFPPSPDAAAALQNFEAEYTPEFYRSERQRQTPPTLPQPTMENIDEIMQAYRHPPAPSPLETVSKVAPEGGRKLSMIVRDWGLGFIIATAIWFLFIR